jgi:pyruvate dehydrogenase (quinone)
VTTERQELTIPPGVTLDQIRGFTLYAARSIFSGNGGEVLRLAKTNLRQLERE